MQRNQSLESDSDEDELVDHQEEPAGPPEAKARVAPVAVPAVAEEASALSDSFIYASQQQDHDVRCPICHEPARYALVADNASRAGRHQRVRSRSRSRSRSPRPAREHDLGVLSKVPEAKRPARDAEDLPCGHFFCRDCISTHLRRQRQCPVCKKPLVMAQMRVDMVRRRWVADLRVKCGRAAQGCPWQDSYGMEGCNWLRHYHRTCELGRQPCANSAAGCTEKLLAGDVAAHLASCPSRLVPCPYATYGCDAEVAASALQDHLRGTHELNRHLELVQRFHATRAPHGPRTLALEVKDWPSKHRVEHASATINHEGSKWYLALVPLAEGDRCPAVLQLRCLFGPDQPSEVRVKVSGAIDMGDNYQPCAGVVWPLSVATLTRLNPIVSSPPFPLQELMDNFSLRCGVKFQVSDWLQDLF